MMGYEGYGATHLIFSILWIVVLVAVVVVAVRWMRHGGKHMHKGCWGCGGDSSALDILKERYAKGEIDKAEFEEKKKDLSN